MNVFRKRKSNLSSEEVLGLKPGDPHYRAYVGPPRDYDLVSAMVFNLLTCLGLRQEHRVLDIGCGSLRVGRLLIPYLSTQCYFGVEPNKWLVDDGVKNEVGRDQIKLKRPTFLFDTSIKSFERRLDLNFVFAQSIFSHCGINLIENWLSEVKPHLAVDGIFLATFLIGDEDFNGAGWVYPDCVKFKVDTIETLAKKHGYEFQILNWAHPRQTWALFSKQGFDRSLCNDGNISWAKAVKARYPAIGLDSE